MAAYWNRKDPNSPLWGQLRARPSEPGFFTMLSSLHSLLFRSLVLALFVFSVLIFFGPNAHSAQITLAWDSSSGADGYRLFYRQDGQSYNYSSPAWEGSDTTCTIVLESQATYYLVVRAYNAYGESGNSDEASITIGGPVVTPDLDYIVIEGPASVNENTTAYYNCRAYYTDGTSQLVEPDSWDVECSHAWISREGLLTTHDVDSDRACQITASYTEVAINSADTHDVTIRDSITPLPEVIADNGGPGTSWKGTWKPSAGENDYGTQSVYSYKDASATYAFAADTEGSYDLYMWWTWYSTRCSSVLVEIYDDNTWLETVEIDQQDRNKASIWNYLGTYTFTGEVRVVVHGKDKACSVCVDAVKFVPGDPQPPPPSENSEVIIDNGGLGTSWKGTWKLSAGENYYGSQSVYSIGDAGDTYTFTANVSGYHVVYLRWTWYSEFSNRCSDVQVDIFDGNTLLDIVYADQEDQSLGGRWNLLGKYFFSGTAWVVIHGQGSGCSTCADAVRFLQ